MQIHGRAKLGPAGRLALCEAIESGLTFRQAARGLGVSPATAHRWWHQYADALPAERHSLAWAADRSSRPRRSPGLLAAGVQERICEARRHTGWGPRLIADKTGIRTRRSGRCCTDMVSHDGRGRHEMLCVATSGRVLETCSTWTPRVMHALSDPGIA
jgi:leucine-zipper of insertion element IS481